MRPVVALGAVASILCLCLGIIAGGGRLDRGGNSTIVIDTEQPEWIEPEGSEPSDETALPQSNAPDGATAPEKSAAGQSSPTDAAGYERIEPRKPLSKIGQAQPPAPKAPNDFDGPALYRPVTNAAGTFEAMGYTVTVAGTEAVDAGEVCSFHGESWP